MHIVPFREMGQTLFDWGLCSSGGSFDCVTDVRLCQYTFVIFSFEKQPAVPCHESILSLVFVSMAAGQRFLPTDDWGRTQDRFHDKAIPEAYERLLLDAIHGDQQHFVRRCVTIQRFRVFVAVTYSCPCSVPNRD